MKELLLEGEIVRKIESPMLYGGSVISVIAGLNLSDWGVVVGIVMTLAGGYMRWREYQFKRREHQLIKQKSEAEIYEIQRRVVFMDKAGLEPVKYHQAPAELEAMKDPQNEQKA